MNRKKLAGLHGKAVRIRPIPKRFDRRLGWLAPVEDYWSVQAPQPADRPPRATNQATGHFIDLISDNVFEFRKPDVIVLKTQLTLTDREVLSNPLPDPRARYVAPTLRTRPATARRLARSRPKTASPLGALICGVLIGVMLGDLDDRRG